MQVPGTTTARARFLPSVVSAACGLAGLLLLLTFGSRAACAQMEQEPNNSIATATLLKPNPASLIPNYLVGWGTISTPNDEDYFGFAVSAPGVVRLGLAVGGVSTNLPGARFSLFDAGGMLLRDGTPTMDPPFDSRYLEIRLSLVAGEYFARASSAWQNTTGTYRLEIYGDNIINPGGGAVGAVAISAPEPGSGALLATALLPLLAGAAALRHRKRAVS